MIVQSISIHDLRDRWESIESAEYLPLSYMPPWNDICSELPWTLHRANGGYFSKKRSGRCGVYRLIGLAVAGDVTKPATINRACGQDTTGTLYIGHARRLHARFNQLRRTLKGRGERSHNAIIMLRNISVLHFPADRLALARLFTCRQTREIEIDLIKAYMNSFGDTPPLNYRL